MAKIYDGEIIPPESGKMGDGSASGASERRVREGFWRTFRKAAASIPFSEDLVASYYCALDPRTPPRVRGILLAALAYFVVPLDLLPDFIAGLGFTDDVTVLAAALGAIRSSIRPAHYEAARAALSDPHPEGK